MPEKKVIVNRSYNVDPQNDREAVKNDSYISRFD